MRISTTLPILILLAGVIVIFYGITHVEDQALAPLTQTSRSPEPQPPLPRITITTCKPQIRKFMRNCPWFGTVQSKNTARVMALISGRITAVHVQDQAQVKVGDPLFTLGGPRLTSRLSTSKIKLTSTKQILDIAHRRVSMKQRAIATGLINHDNLFAAEDELARLKLQAEQARSEIQRLERAMQVRATTSGIFTNRRFAMGQDVNQGNCLAEIVDLDHLRILASMFPPTQASLKDKPVQIELPGGTVTKGAIVATLPQKTITGATQVWIQGLNLKRFLHPGDMVKGSIILGEHVSAISLPAQAVVRDLMDKPFVFLKTDSGYHKVAVNIGITIGGRVEILSGISRNDTVVVSGAYELLYRNFNRSYKVAD